MNSRLLRTALLAALGLGLGGLSASLAAEPRAGQTRPVNLWDLARSKQKVHRFSTLLTAQNVRDHLSTEEGLAAAVAWCRRTGVTKVYIETFRSNYTAERKTLQRARDRFRAEGFEVSGCVTTTLVGKRSTGWNGISCYTDRAAQDRLPQIFEYAAGLFDEIMIDDFWFTDCKCRQCDAARRSRKVTIGDKIYPVSGDTWEDYRRELMVRLSQDRILAPARRVNPKVKVIIKYPQWYDHFHERGYDVVRETAAFDRIWVGTETRDYTDKRWGGTVQYEAYFIMRWLGGIGGEKCGGGWYDPYGTTEKTYVEQARQTVLGGARESLLFCYGSLLRNTGPKNVEALRANIPELLAVAEQVRRRKVMGVAAYKPPNSHPDSEQRVFDFVGMMGLPLVPCHEFPEKAKAAFFSVHALKDPKLSKKLSKLIGDGVPILVTDGLAARLSGKVKLDAPNVHVLPVKRDPKSLLRLPQAELDALRGPLLRPLGRRFEAPGRVALYLFEDGSWVIENFNDEPVTVKLDGQPHRLAPRAWIYRWHPPSGRAQATASAAEAGRPAAAERPNIVLYLSDDHGVDFVGCYGNRAIHTPHIDALAREGLRFTRAFAGSPTCSPSRAILFTGLYPARNGTMGNHTNCRPDVRALPSYLKALGYRVVAANKTDVRPKSVFDWERLPASLPKNPEVNRRYRGEGLDVRKVDAFLAEHRRDHPAQPLCLLLGDNGPHVVWEKNRTYDPAKLPLPPIMVDTPKTRTALANYYQDITTVDARVGQVVASLKRHGFWQNTLLIYTSDQGPEWPHCKWTCYDTGLRVPFIACWPGVVKAGSTTDAMISFVDITPLFVDLAGGRPVAGLDGRSFKDVLLGKARQHDALIFASHTGDGTMNVFPQRCVRDRRWKLIFNLKPQNKWTTHFTKVMGIPDSHGEVYRTWVERAERDAAAARLVNTIERHPRWELYDTDADPYELNNLAAETKYAGLEKELRGRLVEWLKQQHDEEALATMGR